jgi:hypothetical protein
LTDLAKKFWTWTYMSGAVAIILAHVFLVGCVEVGGSSSDVCSGTECGTHDESDRSTDNSDNSSD